MFGYMENRFSKVVETEEEQKNWVVTREMSIDFPFFMLVRVIQHRGVFDDILVNEELILRVKSFIKWERMGYRAQVEGFTCGKDMDTSSF